jgi:hypothetical protein
MSGSRENVIPTVIVSEEEDHHHHNFRFNPFSREEDHVVRESAQPLEDEDEDEEEEDHEGYCLSEEHRRRKPHLYIANET